MNYKRIGQILILINQNKDIAIHYEMNKNIIKFNECKKEYYELLEELKKELNK